MTFMVGLSPKTKRTISSVLKWGLIVVAAGLVVWFAAVSPYLSNREKQRFEKAAAHLEELASEVQAKVGNADEVSRDKNCGYASAKFTRGARSCSVNIKLSYPGLSLEKSNEYMAAISAHVGGTLYPDAGSVGKVTFEQSNRRDQSFGQDFYEEGLLCGISYRYTIAENFEVNVFNRRSGLDMNLNCGGPARAEHYPLREY